MRRSIEVADVIRHFLPSINTETIPLDHYRILDAIAKCRTAALGGHIDQCADCDFLRISYNSCRNRHCPKCQGLNKEMWIIMQEDMLLDVVYYHVVFTLPHELNLLCMYYPQQMYNLLFKAAWHVINTLSLDPQWIGAQTAATMVLHTWSQTMQLHPHLHCIVPNGGLTNKGHWQFPKKGKNNFLFPVQAMKSIFRAFFMENLEAMINKNGIAIPKDYYANNGGSFSQWKNKLYQKQWVVFTKKPFKGSKHVIDYLARYSHKVAITNHRIIAFNTQSCNVTFKYKDYKDKAKVKNMTLHTNEFVRRFSLHFLPKHFRKIRHYGFISNATKSFKIAQARNSIGMKHKSLMDKNQRKSLALKRLNISFNQCPKCKCQMKTIITITSTRPPPLYIIKQINIQNTKI